MSAPWSPMVAPPLPLRSDFLWNTCDHGWIAEVCNGDGTHDEGDTR